MISITRAILHSMDSATQMYFCSNEELLLDVALREYLIKHIEKAKTLNSSQHGKFKLTSKVYAQLKEYDSECFKELTKSIANTWFGAYVETQRFLDMNLLFAEFIDEETKYFAAMQFRNKTGFMRSITKEGGVVTNEILTNTAIMPSTSQSMEEFFIVNLEEYTIQLKENKRYLDASEELLISDQILYCDIELSMKDSLDKIHQIVEKVSEELEEDVLDNSLKVKRFVKSCVETDKKLEIEDIAPVVFPEDVEFAKKFEDLTYEAKLPRMISLAQKTPPTLRKHKIKTDMGIEISIPVDYVDSEDTLVVHTNEDGTVSVSLNHIGKII